MIRVGDSRPLERHNQTVRLYLDKALTAMNMLPVLVSTQVVPVGVKTKEGGSQCGVRRALPRSIAMMMDRHVSFESCFNFRDLGGYLTTDGRTVRWGCVFRSGSLRLTPADFAVLQRLRVRTVIDLRSTRELESEGRSGYLGELDYHHVPLFEQEALPFRPFEVGRPDPPQGEMYLSIAVACGDSVARCLRTIAECDHAVVFHCAAGRDRTGIVAAILLASLGVPDETIVTDYALSDRALEPWLTWAKVNDTKVAADIEALPNSLLTASPQSLIFLLEGVRSSYGSIEKYLVGIGVGADVVGALRSRLLE